MAYHVDIARNAEADLGELYAWVSARPQQGPIQSPGATATILLEWPTENESLAAFLQVVKERLHMPDDCVPHGPVALIIGDIGPIVCLARLRGCRR